MTRPGLTDEQRGDLYHTLLMGMAREARDRMCAADQSHAWGPWIRYVVKPDLDDLPLAPLAPGEPIPDIAFLLRARRTCENCGKEQTA